MAEGDQKSHSRVSPIVKGLAGSIGGVAEVSWQARVVLHGRRCRAMQPAPQAQRAVAQRKQRSGMVMACTQILEEAYLVRNSMFCLSEHRADGGCDQHTELLRTLADAARSQCTSENLWQQQARSNSSSSRSMEHGGGMCTQAHMAAGMRNGLIRDPCAVHHDRQYQHQQLCRSRVTKLPGHTV